MNVLSPPSLSPVDGANSSLEKYLDSVVGMEMRSSVCFARQWKLIWWTEQMEFECWNVNEWQGGVWHKYGTDVSSDARGAQWGCGGEDRGGDAFLFYFFLNFSKTKKKNPKALFFGPDMHKKHRKRTKLPWRRNIKLSFWSLSFVFFSSCLFCLLSFCIFVFCLFVFQSRCIFTPIKCPKGLTF